MTIPLSPRMFVLTEVPGYTVQLKACDCSPQGITAARAVALSLARKLKQANPDVKNDFLPFPNLAALAAYEATLPSGVTAGPSSAGLETTATNATTTNTNNAG